MSRTSAAARSAAGDVSSAAPAVELTGVTVRYGRITALEDVSLVVPAGIAVGIIGPNGAGKSTLLKAVAGLVPIAAGSLRVFGCAPGALPRGAVGYVPQLDEIERTFPVTVRDVVAMGRFPHLAPLQRFSADDRRIVEAALTELDLGDLAGRRIADLSGGQQQRAFLARAIAQQPRVLLLDEPASGIDARSEDALRRSVRGTVARGIPVLMTTHDLDELERWFDRAIVVDHRIVADALPGEIGDLAGTVLPRKTRL